ncbi:MAG TPA: orotate phosphoribosyltransferase [Candidatus Stercoripulliclostridium merdigallinarum]|uniref:Orotate phosphoribosyltransferase n=1 Tax=Candidatus Stercoripulliclostridium merdigallinarum TaxID=2840951 RepID=A0A9D1SHR3_9FIRM|nr:orotate phosphoribosyltransferase [Candidatus Stercoripulliclostridium merdigallinarum]
MSTDNKTLAAKALLKAKAVFLRPSEPFTWASGIKSPVYCDNRLLLGFPEIRAEIENILKEVIESQYPEVEVLMGTSTAGIPHAAIVAEKMGLPMGYVRSGNKDHGRGNRIEGADPRGKKTVIVEDLISTGGSVIEVAEALREAGAEVLGIASLFTYGLQKGIDRLAAANLKNVSITDFERLSAVALEENYITAAEYKMVTAFRNDPNCNWFEA